MMNVKKKTLQKRVLQKKRNTNPITIETVSFLLFSCELAIGWVFFVVVFSFPRFLQVFFGLVFSSEIFFQESGSEIYRFLYCCALESCRKRSQQRSQRMRQMTPCMNTCERFAAQISNQPLTVFFSTLCVCIGYSKIAHTVQRTCLTTFTVQ